jgi:hypothetical protein
VWLVCLVCRICLLAIRSLLRLLCVLCVRCALSMLPLLFLMPDMSVLRRRGIAALETHVIALEEAINGGPSPTFVTHAGALDHPDGRRGGHLRCSPRVASRAHRAEGRIDAGPTRSRRCLAQTAHDA